MNGTDLAEAYALLGLSPGCGVDEVERAYLRRNFAVLKGAGDALGGVEARRAQLKGAYERVLAHVKATEEQARAAAPRREAGAAPVGYALPRATGLVTPPKLEPRAPEGGEFSLTAFDNWLVNVLVPPLLLAVTWALTVSPLGFFLKGFHVWMHEFGHAVPAWLAGWRATPLPIGWTPVEPVHSNFVYYGLLALFAVLFVAGAKERKIWPMLAALGLAAVQFVMTWKLPEYRKEFWMVAGGVGGEFVLGTLFMMAFYVQLPDKFRWGACRYVFFFIGATAFLAIWMRWRDIYRGLEEIPFGSMINGEEDAGGDMNRLKDDYGWTNSNLRQRFYFLGLGCWAALGVTWLAFALRLNRVADWAVARFGAKEEVEG